MSARRASSKLAQVKKIPKVDRNEFESVVGRLLKQPPVKRNEVKTGTKKARMVIPQRSPHQSDDDKA